jgi:ABC-type multidrug transport system fused ATPase/permease subunit
MARLGVFFVAVIAAAWLFSLPSLGALAAAALVASVALFLALVVWHTRLRRAAVRARRLHDLNLQGAARVRRDWDALPRPREPLPADHPYAIDLDVAGTPASLVRLVDVVSAATGRPTLLRWLLEPSPAPDIIRSRQRAVAELASMVDFREELALLGSMSGEIAPDRLDHFLSWTGGEGWEPLARSVVWGAWLIPFITLITAVLAFTRRLPWLVPGLSLAAGVLLMARARAAIETTLTNIFSHATGLRTQREMLERIAATRFESPLLAELRQQSAGGAEALHHLERALSLVEGRGSLIHGIANAVALWEVHAVNRLDRWRLRHGTRLREQLAALGSVEALAALATLAHDNPGFAFPTIDTSSDRVRAVALAHPLLAADTRVGNDVTIGPPGTLLLVTGSNMSGKSTLLRAIGLNVVLAQAGAPVCAASLTMPLVALHTSIRLADSLERGMSLFMAELQRLKAIVDAARAELRDRPLLYLLDEILHGTNSAERRIAARAVLGHLVRAGAIGAVTTHDLALAAEGELASVSVPVHFTEQIGNGSGGAPMTFDYRLRPGLATSTNALRLLALVGLAEPPAS